MIHHFLNQHTLFEKIELIQFKPTKDQIYFEFDLKIDTREKINEQKIWNNPYNLIGKFISLSTAKQHIFIVSNHDVFHLLTFQ